MFEEYAGQKVLNLFFREPYREFHLREAARESKVSPMTAKKQLDRFADEGIVEKSKKANLVLFMANTKNKRFQLMKAADSIEKIGESGLLKALTAELNPVSIVLFGSTARGQDSKDSDIDLLVISKKKQEIDFEAYERKLKRKINLIIYDSPEWKKKATDDKPFYLRILLDGIALHGELPVVL